MKHLARFGTLVGMLVGFAALQAPAANAVPTDTYIPSSCSLRTELGTKYYAHGTVISVVTRTGERKEYRCNDGSWESVMYGYSSDTSSTTYYAYP